MSPEDVLLQVVAVAALFTAFAAGFRVGLMRIRRKFVGLEKAFLYEINRVPGVESVPGIGKERGAAVREYFRGILGGET